MTKHFKKVLISVLAFAAVCIFSLTVFAAETGSAKVVFRPDDEMISGVSFRLYQVAVRDENFAYHLTEAFAECPVSLDDVEQEDMADLSSTISDYVFGNDVAAYEESKTNEAGEITFNDLPEGLYLLLGNSVSVKDVMYIPQASLFFVPSGDLDGNMVYDITLMPKYEKREMVERRVVKIWKDEGYTEQRPQEITVQLLCDGEVFDEQVLNAANDWSYTWSDLESAHDWQLKEKEVPEDYEVSVELDGITFTVTNTYIAPPTPTPSPSPSPTPSGTPEPDLPETGMLWWSVPVLISIGLILCTVGYFLFRSREEEK